MHIERAIKRGEGKTEDLADWADDFETDSPSLDLRALRLLVPLSVPPLGLDLLLPPRHLTLLSLARFRRAKSDS